MKNPDNLQMEQQNKILQFSRGLDPLAILNLLKKNWYWLAFGIVMGLLCSRFYIRHTMPVFKTSATILINETEKSGTMSNADLLQGLGLPGGMANLENQMLILKSRELTEKTLKELTFETEWYFKTFRNKLPIYPEVPFKLIFENEIPLPKDTEFSISNFEANRFTLKCDADYFPIDKAASFGDTIELPGGNLRVECINEDWLKSNKEEELFFIVHSRSYLISHYSGRIDIELISSGGSVLKISMLGTNPAKDAVFINTHLENFQNISLGKKNMEAERRIQFIDDQLIGISDSLSTTENKLQQFRSTNRIMNISAQGSDILTLVASLENERARLNLEANYYDYLAEYLTKESSSEIPIVPITMGISDPGLTKLVGELAEYQNQSYAGAGGEMNPLQRSLEQKIRTTKEALRETLNGLRRANSLARSENQERINQANAKASALPIKERQLLGIERKFKLNDELYTFLLETRAEQQMQRASNRADSEIIDKADQRFSSVVSPDSIKVRFVGMFAGVGTPFLIIFLIFIFNKGIKDEDIRGMSDLPVVGNIPHSDGQTKTVVLDNSNSATAEAFRIMRSRVQFLTKEAISPVILITSSMPDDGKTFTAVNLASVYSLLGKKTVLVGFDLRKPKIYDDFNLKNEHGVSTWLIGKDSIDEIIQETSFENLAVILAGPVPPNPSELTALEKTKDLFKLLKERYDYVVIDSSPIGIVSDTYYLANLSDACLLVVRSGKTLREIFENTIHEINGSGLNGVSVVINDIKSDSKHYGYGEKYGYTNDEKRTKKHSFKRNLIKKT